MITLNKWSHDIAPRQKNEDGAPEVQGPDPEAILRKKPQPKTWGGAVRGAREDTGS